MSGSRMKRMGLAVVAIAAVAMSAQASPQAVVQEMPTPSHQPEAVRMDLALAALLVKRFPDLGKLNGFGAIPFAEVSGDVAERVSASRKITLVVYPTEGRAAIANNYLIYTVPCDADVSRSCHYLGVMTQFGMPIQRMYGPLDLEAKPAMELKLSGV